VIEIAIIVQIKDVGGHGKGRMGVGFSKFTRETLLPEKKWSEYFFDALRRAMKNRQVNLEDVRKLVSEQRPLFDKLKQDPEKF
jgi:hypothetical protein